MIAILDHGPGFYPEQSQEKLKKPFKKIREFNSRKTIYRDMIDNIFTSFYIKYDTLFFNNSV